MPQKTGLLQTFIQVLQQPFLTDCQNYFITSTLGS